MSKNFSRGSSEQMIAAFEHRIDELQNTSSVTSATAATKNRSFSRGSSDQMLAAFENRIAELNGNIDTVNSSDDITAAYRDDIIEDDVLGASEMDPSLQERYIHTLIGDVDEQLSDYGQFESWTWDQNATEGTIILTTVVGEQVHEYSIPLDDLSQSFDSMGSDVEYILSAVLQGGGAADKGTAVESATIADNGQQVFQLMEYSSNPESGMDGDDFYCYGEFFATDIEDAQRQLEEAKQQYHEFFENNDKYVDNYNEYFSTDGEIYQNISAILQHIDQEDTYRNDLPFASTQINDDFANGLEDSEVKIEGQYELDSEGDNIIEWFNNATSHVEDAGWIGDGEIIVTLNHGAQDIESMSADLISCIEDNGYYVTDWNVNGNNVFIFTLSDSVSASTSTEEPWVQLESKSVLDMDGFSTDYTLYRNADSTMFICMFGDKDVYTPDLEYADFETEDEQEAYDWFYSYSGFEEDAEIM